jgi:hypothetical protein
LALVVTCTITGVFAVRPALAFPTYRLEAIKLLKLEPDKPDGTRVVGCTFCHVNPEGGAPWNPFGIRVQAALTGDIRQAIFVVLSEMRDSDVDGYEDALEVFAKTMPGDPKSVPQDKRDMIKERFDKSGGLEQYRP